MDDCLSELLLTTLVGKVTQLVMSVRLFVSSELPDL